MTLSSMDDIDRPREEVPLEASPTIRSSLETCGLRRGSPTPITLACRGTATTTTSLVKEGLLDAEDLSEVKFQWTLRLEEDLHVVVSCEGIPAIVRKIWRRCARASKEDLSCAALRLDLLVLQ